MILNDKSVLEVNHTRLPNAADILGCIKEAISPAYNYLLEPVIDFSQKVPVSSGCILEWHFNKTINAFDFSSRLNCDFDTDPNSLWIQHTPENTRKKLCDIISHKRKTFKYGIENIWLEYDAPFNNPPSLFVDIDRGKTFSPPTVYSSLNAIMKGFNVKVDLSVLDFLERLKEIHLRVVYFGCMFSRVSQQSIRMTINDVSPNDLGSFLQTMGWDGCYDALDKIQSLYLSSHQKLVIGLDFCNKIEKRISIEVFDDDYCSFALRLLENDLINKCQYQYLINWPQSIVLPDSLKYMLTKINNRFIHTVYTRFNHFKFIISEYGEIEVKGYLYYCF